MDKSISPEFSNLINYIVKDMSPSSDEEIAIKQYIKLILTIARKYVRPGVDYEDLIMCGIMGLIEATHHFDPERSTNFRNYAIVRIKGRLYEYFISNSTPISIPMHVSKTKVHVEKMTRLLDKEPYIFRNNIDVEQVIRKFEHPIEKHLPQLIKNKLRRTKDMVSKIAANSKTTYQNLINNAYISMVTLVPEEKLQSCVYNSNEDPIEREALFNQTTDRLTSHMGAKKTKVLVSHYQGFTNEDIADQLAEEGHTPRRITRQAVRGLLKGAEIKAKKHVRDN